MLLHSNCDISRTKLVGLRVNLADALPCAEQCLCYIAGRVHKIRLFTPRPVVGFCCPII
jgi:hypothetical protein